MDRDGGLSTTVFSIDVRHPGSNTSELLVRGDLDMVSAPNLGELGDGLEPRKKLIVDLSGVTFMDSTGLRALWTLRQNMAAHGGKVLLRAPSMPVMRVLKTTKLDKVFEYADGEIS